ncbi:inactive protein RESTRICTED TEV MOVEMENT 2 [Ziziphus jujuba]|uniref:Inactive protein RESTRICTED TEV MOVEMENT 2 n=1 Tax=Ziziphus jujuba TaxID=326968 RepID=A0A6P4APL3_ZIZJJ|nr:inactive protein RESTRICTED TEV MOVEMENT 2 [Ziziphus jujuba]
MANKIQPDLKRSYEDFEPFCQWKRDNERDILEVHLEGFKKEQLRVQFNNSGILTITGEKPIDETKCSRFKKEINIAKDSDSNKIRAKLSRGVLLITIPKITSMSSKQAAVDPASAATEENIQAKENALSSGLRNAISSLKLSRKMALNVLVVAATFAIIGVGSYVSWKCLKPAPTDET